MNEAERRLGASKAHVQYLGENIAEQSNQLVAKIAEMANERE